MNARASNVLQHIISTKGQKMPFSPAKTFDNTNIYHSGFAGKFARDIRQVDISDKTKSKPFFPSKALSDSCYARIDKDSNGALLERAPLKVGTIPTQIRRPSLSMFDGGLNLPEKYKRDMTFTSIISGGWVGARLQFERFCDGTRKLNTSWTRRVKNIMCLDKRFEHLTTLKTPGIADIWFMPFRGSALPGGDSTNSFKNKFSGWKSSCLAATKLWEHIHSNYAENLSIYTCGGKEKVAYDKSQGDRLQSRLVCQQDQVEFQVAKPYVRNIEQYLFNDFLQPIKIGRAMQGFRFNTLLSPLLQHKYGFEFDWSGYDSTVNAEFIIAAFAWCRSLFEDSEEIDRAFCYFCASYVYKFMVTPDSNTFKVSRGCPSGSAWTTIINSVVNCLLIEDICANYGSFAGKPFNYMVAGDDGDILWDQVVNFKPENLIKWIKRRYDMDLEVTGVGPCISDDPNKSLSFNKKCYYWDNGFAQCTTVPKLLAKRLFPVSSSGSQASAFLTATEGQYYEILGHPDCKTILGVASAFSHDNVNAISIYDTVSLVTMTNSELYYSAQSERLYNRDIYSVDKIHPLEDEACWKEPVNTNFVANWLYDNTDIPRENFKLSTKSRLKWFQTKMGDPIPVSVLWRLLQRERIDVRTFGIPQKEIDFIYKIWCKYFTIDPANYDHRLAT